MRKKENINWDYGFFSTKQAAKAFEVCESTIRNWIKKDQLLICGFIENMIVNKKSAGMSTNNTLMKREFIGFEEASKIYKLPPSKIKLLVCLGEISSIKEDGIIKVVHYKID